MSLPEISPEQLKQYKEFFVPGKQVMIYLFDEFHTWLFGQIVEWKQTTVKIKFRDEHRHYRWSGDFPEFEAPLEHLDIYVKGV